MCAAKLLCTTMLVSNVLDWLRHRLKVTRTELSLQQGLELSEQLAKVPGRLDLRGRLLGSGERICRPPTYSAETSFTEYSLGTAKNRIN